MARATKQDGAPHPHTWRITHKGVVTHVRSLKAASRLPGRKEITLWRMMAYLPHQEGDLVTLKRVPIYGATPEVCRNKVDQLRRASTLTIDQARFNPEYSVNLTNLRLTAEALQLYDDGIARFDMRPRREDSPLVRDLAREAIRRKEERGRNTTSDRAHVGKLDLPAELDGVRFKLGGMKCHEVTQRHVIEWTKMVSRLPGRSPGSRLSEHSVELAVAMLKSAWSELTHGAHAELRQNVSFAELGDLYRGASGPAIVEKSPVPVETLREVCALPDMSQCERSVVALLLAGLRPNEVGAIRPEDVVEDEDGRLWLEPYGSVSANGRKWRPQTKVGSRENRSLPLTKLQERLLEGSTGGQYVAEDGSGKPLDTDNVRSVFRELVRRANRRLGPGEDAGTMRHTVLTEVTRAAGYPASEAWGHGKVPSSMAARKYSLLEMRERRRLGRGALVVAGKPVCDLLPWAGWTPFSERAVGGVVPHLLPHD